MELIRPNLIPVNENGFTRLVWLQEINYPTYICPNNIEDAFIYFVENQKRYLEICVVQSKNTWHKTLVTNENITLEIKNLLKEKYKIEL